MKAIWRIQEFISDSRAVGIVLLSCTALSLLLSNSPWAGSWQAFWHLSPGNDGTGDPTQHSWTVGSLHFPLSLTDWLNDLGMPFFFFMAGMEIKRELTTGELSTIRQAMLPVAAAIGGMVVPAALFITFAHGTTFSHGWGIPMATDIAFSLGVAAILGSRMPTPLKVFLTALAIIDDLGSILVIALFYSGGLHWIYLLSGLGLWLMLLLSGYLKIRFGWLQFLLGLVLWYCIFNSGIHATIAGVLLAFTVPTSQLQELEHRIHLPVNFLVIPLFALANTAIALPADLLGQFGSALSLGILSGLLIGKTLGVTAAVFFLVRSGVSSLPLGTSWRQVMGTGLLAGIGFTMSIFITVLAFDRPEHQDTAKIAVVAASLLAMAGSIAWFRWTGGKPQTTPS